MTENGSGIGLSVKELVLEVRNDVKALSEKIDKIDRQGSIGTREELADHERRIRRVEAWKYALPPTLVLVIASIVIDLVHVHM